VEVDVFPADPEDLAAANPGVGGKIDRRVEVMVSDALEELAAAQRSRSSLQREVITVYARNIRE